MSTLRTLANPASPFSILFRLTTVQHSGDSERLIGKFLRENQIPRSRIVILTKCFFGTVKGKPQDKDNDLNWVNQHGLSRRHIFDAVNASLERLGVDYIDLLQIHRLDKTVPAEETMRALNDVVESGKVLYVGASSMPAWEFISLQHVADKHGWHKFVSMQVSFCVRRRHNTNQN